MTHVSDYTFIPRKARVSSAGKPRKKLFASYGDCIDVCISHVIFHTRHSFFFITEHNIERKITAPIRIRENLVDRLAMNFS